MPERYGRRGGDDVAPHVRKRLLAEGAAAEAERQREAAAGAVDELIAELERMMLRNVEHG